MPLFSLPLGVPPLLPSGYVSFSFLPPPIADADVFGAGPTPRGQWGLFDGDGNPVVVIDSVVSFEFLNEFRVSDYPQEQGGFQSYNKVATPFDVRLALARGGTDSDRTEFILGLDKALNSLDLYDVVTPEFTYPNVSVVRVNVHRVAHRGVTLLVAETWVREIRENASAALSNSLQPSGADPVNGGLVQPQPPSSAQNAVITKIPLGVPSSQAFISVH